MGSNLGNRTLAGAGRVAGRCHAADPQWGDPLADRIAASNLYLDSAKARRWRELEALREKHGRCRADGPFAAENALRGEWVMPCERGAIRVAIRLPPIVPPKVQYLAGRSQETVTVTILPPVSCIE